jgi:hypothetical protein
MLDSSLHDPLHRLRVKASHVAEGSTAVPQDLEIFGSYVIDLMDAKAWRLGLCQAMAGVASSSEPRATPPPPFSTCFYTKRDQSGED